MAILFSKQELERLQRILLEYVTNTPEYVDMDSNHRAVVKKVFYFAREAESE
jgi:hypothetical protein